MSEYGADTMPGLHEVSYPVIHGIQTKSKTVASFNFFYALGFSTLQTYDLNIRSNCQYIHIY